MAEQYDVLVIGAGPGGYPAAIRAAQLGLKTACVERDKLGGVCLNWGCIPSKALLKTAELVRELGHAKDWGLSVGEVGIDFEAVVGRSRKVADRHNRGVAGLFKKYGVTSIVGTATITGPGRVRVGDVEITAKHVVIATGARAKWFPGMEPDGERILTYREAIVATERPASVTIVGAGAIGIEFAYFWNAMGVSVDVVEAMPEILPVEDREAAETCRKALAKQGIRFHLGKKVQSVARHGDGTITTLEDGTTLEAARALVALGIRPNVEDLGLETVGIRVGRGGIEVDASLRTNVPGFYAVGDCNATGPALAHTATRQAHVCVERIAGHEAPDVDYGNMPSCTYCQPQVASVGLTEEAARAQGRDYTVGRFPFLANGKAQGGMAADGWVKVLIDNRYGEILGAHIVGAEATELLAELVVARSAEVTAEHLSNTVHAHPTFGEAVMEAVAQGLGTTVHL